MKILVTGAAGFIGFHLCKSLVEKGKDVVGIDNINDYYDVNLKYARLDDLGIDRSKIEDRQVIDSNTYGSFKFSKVDLVEKDALFQLFEKEEITHVCNMAAQAGVRYSLINPTAYIASNIEGFGYLIEACREYKIKHFVYASSSSVYGLNETLPFSEDDNVDHPISLYAATKKSNELIAHAYSHLFKIPTTGLRFFTVYGPWGRPDMAIYLFTEAIMKDEPIRVFNHGNMERDFTYVDDVVFGVENMIDKPPSGNASWDGKKPDPSSSKAPFQIFNIGNSKPVKLIDFIQEIEKNLGKNAKLNFEDLQPGDVVRTQSNISRLKDNIGYEPKTSVKEGIKNFVEWYKKYYKVQ